MKPIEGDLNGYLSGRSTRTADKRQQKTQSAGTRQSAAVGDMWHQVMHETRGRINTHLATHQTHMESLLAQNTDSHHYVSGTTYEITDKANVRWTIAQSSHSPFGP